MTYYYRLTIFLLIAVSIELLQAQIGFVICLPVALWLILHANKEVEGLTKAFIIILVLLSIGWGIFYAVNWGLLLVWFLGILGVRNFISRLINNELVAMLLMLISGLISYTLLFQIPLASILLQLLISLPLSLVVRNFLDDSTLYTNDRRFRI